MRRAVPLAQLLATALILGVAPGNGLKLVLMLVVWALGFRQLDRRELLIMLAINALFFIMNSGALRQGVFRFAHPDVLGIPVYEFFMWGFYTVNAMRFVAGPPVMQRRGLALGLAAAFAVPFTTIADPTWLLVSTGIVLLIALAVFHERSDLVSTGYFICMGTLIEYVGVWTGQWSYPSSPMGGVPLWFVTMWGGVGLFTRRLLG